MANKLRIKRRTSGATAPITSDLANAELACNEVSNILYYGKGGDAGQSNSVIAIGGSGAFAALDLSHTFTTGVTSTYESGSQLTTASGSTINIAGTWQIDGQQVNPSADELNVLDGVTAGTVSASKAVVVDAYKNVTFDYGSVTAGSITTTSDGTIGGNLTVTGDLTVDGDVAQVAAAVITVGTYTNDDLDRGIEFRWNNGSSRVGFFGFNEVTGTMTFIPDAANTSGVFSGTRGTINVGAVHIDGTLIAASNLDDGTTGTGPIVLDTNSTITGVTLVTPALGTPTSGTLTNCTDLPVTGLSGLGTDVATFLATPSSANLITAVTDETGSGSLVFATSPTITTSIVAGSASMDIFNSVATTVNAFGAATALGIGASTGTTTIKNNLTVTGDLIINGATTTVNATTVTIDDPIFVLGGDGSGINDSKDRGIEFRWNNGAAKIGFFGFDSSSGKMTFIPDATNNAEVFTGSVGTIDVGAVHISGVAIAASNLSNGVTGATSVVLASAPTITSPTLVTPALGTPTSGTLTSCTDLPVSTGISGLGNNVATFLATPTSSNLAAAVSDETGSGVLVFNTSPTLYTPTLGAASATSINKVAITAPATSATITVVDGKTFTCSNTLTFTGTDNISVAFGAVTGTVAMLGTANAFTGANTFTHATGQTFRPTTVQDGIIIQGRAGGSSSYAATFTTAELSANRTITFPNETGTVVTTASVCAAIAECTIDGGTF